jgi:hypothetical protein
MADELVDQIAQDIAACWKENADSACDASQIAAATIGRIVAAIAEGVAKSLLDIRSLLADALKQASGTTAHTDGPIDGLPSASGMPVLDLSEITSRLQVHRPTLGFLGTTVLSHGIRKQLEMSIATDLTNALHRYGKRLDEWRSQFLRELRGVFTAAADLYRAWPDQDRPSQADKPQNDSSSLQRDIERLERYAAAPTQAAAHETRTGGIVS